MKILFYRSLYPSIPNHRELSCELLTWIIPPHLDPTYDQAPASQLDELGAYLKHSQSRGTSRQPRAPLDFSRRWGSTLQAGITNAPIPATEPSEKTHFLFFI